MDIANSIDWMLPNCPEACADLGDVAGLPLDPSDDKYEKLSNDVIVDQVSSNLIQLIPNGDTNTL